ncbi:hypothetical protein [Roseisalinus antarcticus]|uniref:hypothetical protein n=1 Tax=Roseisalinus antarcticus TaxID=254357 RepID=UPI000A27131A|nr:hypothetical protein [Roseisalinus antarcticus]
MPVRSLPERLSLDVLADNDLLPAPIAPPSSLARIAHSAPPRPDPRGDPLRVRLGRLLIRLGERLADPPRPA